MKKVLMFVIILLPLMGCSEKTFVDTTYDDNGNLILEKVKNSKDILTSRTSYEYHENGEMSNKEVHKYEGELLVVHNVKNYNENGEILNSRIFQWEYDKKGNLIIEWEFPTPDIRVVHRTKFDELTRPIKKEQFSLDKEGEINKSSETILTYHDNGNRSTMTKYHYNSDGEVIRTEITTYDENGSIINA